MSARAAHRAVSAGSRVDSLLADAQGYAVRDTGGERLGRLIWLTYSLDDDGPAGLRVQPDGPGEATLSGSWEIPRAQVVTVRPALREVIVATERSRRADHRDARPAAARYEGRSGSSDGWSTIERNPSRPASVSAR